MSHRNHDNPGPDSGELRARKMRLVEGGVVFVLALSICIYLGIRFADDPSQDVEPIAATITQPDIPTNYAIESEPAGTMSAAATAPVGTEPADVVESEISATPGESLSMAEIAPEVPLMVTYSTAEAAFLEGRYADAADMFTTYCDDHAENAWGHYMRGLALWKAGDLDASRSAFGDALTRKPDHFKSMVNLARVELDLAEPDAALLTIQRALDIAPENTAARRVQGRTFHNLDRHDEAAAAYVEVLKLDADDAWTLNNLALIWIEQEQFDRAVAPLARAVELAPDVAVIRNNLGTALERTGHLAQAAEQFELAGSLGSDRGEASLARLDAVVIPAGVPALDLVAVAAAWTVPTGEAEVADAMAAVTFDDAETVAER